MGGEGQIGGHGNVVKIDGNGHEGGHNVVLPGGNGHNGEETPGLLREDTNYFSYSSGNDGPPGLIQTNYAYQEESQEDNNDEGRPGLITTHIDQSSDDFDYQADHNHSDDFDYQADYNHIYSSDDTGNW